MEEMEIEPTWLENLIINLIIVIFTLFVAALISTYIKDKLDSRPIRFEDFKTAKELQVFLEEKYPIGSDAMPPYQLLIDMGAECKIVTKNKGIPNSLKHYGFVGRCDYTTSLFSFDPLQHHLVIVLGNDKNEIVEFFVAKHFAINF